ncbi:MAG: hypothetical protein WCA13_07815 [Terriglobales bacterium]
MIAVRRLLLIVSFISIVSAGSAFGSATNIYITANGSPSGNCTTNVQTPAFVTTAGNWGSGSGQIGSGTTVLFCGTFTLPVGGSLASFLGSGTSSNAITFKLDSNAVIQSQAMGSASSGAFNCSGKSYVTVDGGSNGIIQNTANGTGLTKSQASQGLYFVNCINIVVKNLNIQNIYQNAGSNSHATDTHGVNTSDVYFDNGNSTGAQIFNNTLNDARTGIAMNFDDGGDASNVLIYGNTISDHGWSIQFGADNSSSTASGVVIHDNNISGWTNWQFPDDTYHTDGLILYNDSGRSAAYDTYTIYNNQFSGTLGNGSPTGYIACGVMSTCTIFNNLMVDNGSYPSWGYIWLYTPNGTDAVYNNTLIASSNGGVGVTLGDDAGLGGGTASHLTVKNNIFTNVTYGLHDYRSLTTDITASDENVWRTPSGSAPAFETNDSTQISFATWQNDGFDVSSTTSDPKLGSNYVPQSGSSAIGLGANLTGLDISSLDFDMADSPRPGSGSWVAGTYDAAGGPAPPQGLVAVVH